MKKTNLFSIALLSFFVLASCSLSPTDSTDSQTPEETTPEIPPPRAITPQNIPDDWATYESPEAQFKFKYPSDLEVKGDPKTVALMNDQSEVIFAIILDKALLVPALPQDKMEQVSINGINGTLLHGFNNETDTDEDRLIVVAPLLKEEGKIYVDLRGYGDTYNQIISTLEIEPL